MLKTTFFLKEKQRQYIKSASLKSRLTQFMNQLIQRDHWNISDMIDTILSIFKWLCCIISKYYHQFLTIIISHTS